MKQNAIPYPSKIQAKEWLSECRPLLTQWVGEECMPLESPCVLGSGGWGCVFETITPGVGLKLTLDRHEPVFVRTAHALKEWPLGIAKHYACLDTELLFNGRRVFAVWRELVDLMDRPIFWPHAKSEEAEELEFDLDAYCDYSQYAMKLIKSGYNRPSDDAPSVDSLDGIYGRTAIEKTIGRLAPARQLAMVIEKASLIANESAETLAIGKNIMRGLSWYLRRGIVLNDVHVNNVGLVQAQDGSMVDMLVDCGNVGLLYNSPDMRDQKGLWVNFT